MNNGEIEDAVLDVWVGQRNNMNEKVKNNSFNWCAFLFGGYYFLYRKMYLIGILDMIVIFCIPSILGIISYDLKPYILLIIYIVTPIIHGFIFSPLYKKHIKNVLNKNINRNMNPIQIAQMKGGVNSGAVGIAIGIVFAIEFIFVLFFISIGIIFFNNLKYLNLDGDSNYYDNNDNNYYYDEYNNYKSNPSILDDYEINI